MLKNELKKKLVTNYFCNAFLHHAISTVSRLGKIQAKYGLLKRNTKTLIVYSRKAYDPESSTGTFLDQSGGVRLIRKIISVIGEEHVTYIGQEDILDTTFDFTCFDQIIGISCKSTRLAFKINKKSSKIYLAVNGASVHRNCLILKKARQHKLAPSSMELVNPLTEWFIIRAANIVLVLGNENTISSFASVYNIMPRKITNVKNDYFITHQPTKEQKKYNIIYPSSFLCIRKGLLSLAAVLAANDKLEHPLKFAIVGGLAHEYDEIYKTISSYKNVKIFDWVDATQLKKLYQSSEIALLLSIEEGQVSTMIEAIEAGCVPVCSVQCGLPINEGIKLVQSEIPPSELLHILQDISKNHDEHVISTKKYYQNSFTNYF